MSAINSLQPPAITVTRRTEAMSSDVITQLKSDFNDCSFLSLQYDESTDLSHISQLAVFTRMVFQDFTVEEELVKIVPMEGRTRGEDIYSVVKSPFDKKQFPMKQIVDMTTDGAPAILGLENGFIALCRKDKMFTNDFLSYHCIIHQQALCGKFLNFGDLMSYVVKLVNKIKASAVQKGSSKN